MLRHQEIRWPVPRGGGLFTRSEAIRNAHIVDAGLDALEELVDVPGVFVEFSLEHVAELADCASGAPARRRRWRDGAGTHRHARNGVNDAACRAVASLKNEGGDGNSTRMLRDLVPQQRAFPGCRRPHADAKRSFIADQLQ